MAESKTAKQRFVEAMRPIACLLSERYVYPDLAAAITAMDAFADAECAGDLEDMRVYAHDHAACRATLRKECGIE